MKKKLRPNGYQAMNQKLTYRRYNVGHDGIGNIVNEDEKNVACMVAKANALIIIEALEQYYSNA